MDRILHRLSAFLMHRADDHGVALCLAQSDHPGPHPRSVVQHVEHFLQFFPEVQRVVQYVTHMIQSVQFMLDERLASIDHSHHSWS